MKLSTFTDYTFAAVARAFRSQVSVNPRRIDRPNDLFVLLDKAKFLQIVRRFFVHRPPFLSLRMRSIILF